VVGSSTPSGSDDTSDSASQVSIVSTREFVVDATVSSADVGSVKKGLQAQVTPTGATQTVYGTVLEVGVVAETSSSGAAVFPVTIEVTGRHPDLYAGTSADAAIVVSRRDGVLVVPSRALQTDGDTTYVDKVVGDRTVKTTVQIGQACGANTEVVSGLAEGDEVEVPGFTLPSGGGDGKRGELPGGGTFFQDGGPGGGPGGGPVTQQNGPGQ
ncbi:MAG: efflux RND transporter periplasmic adaptor subunit, partial [Thermoanaerobaculia bacterium]